MASPKSSLDPLRPLRSIGRILVDNLGRPSYYFGRSSRRSDDAGMPGDTVLLIHGFFQTRGVMQTLEQRLRADGFRVISFNSSCPGVSTRFTVPRYQ